MWRYEFYQDAEGNEPVKDFLLSLDAKRRRTKKISEKELRIARVRMKNNYRKRR